MNENKPRGIKFIGITNIIFGLIFLIYLAVPFFFMVIGGWTADRGPHNFLDWLTLFFLNRITLGVFYLSFILLIWSGLLTIRGRLLSIKLNIITAFLISLNGIIFVLCSFVNNIIQRGLGLKFALENLGNLGDFFMFYIPCAYAIFLIIYFSRRKVKEQFR